MNDLTLPWMAELGIMGWRTISKEKRPPLPSELLATFVIFGGFSLIPNQRLRSTLGWGIVVASLLNLLGTGELLLHPFGNSTANTASGPVAPTSNSQKTPTVTTPGGAKAQ